MPTRRWLSSRRTAGPRLPPRPLICFWSLPVAGHISTTRLLPRVCHPLTAVNQAEGTTGISIWKRSVWLPCCAEGETEAQTRSACPGSGGHRQDCTPPPALRAPGRGCHIRFTLATLMGRGRAEATCPRPRARRLLRCPTRWALTWGVSSFTFFSPVPRMSEFRPGSRE